MVHTHEQAEKPRAGHTATNVRARGGGFAAASRCRPSQAGTPHQFRLIIGDVLNPLRSEAEAFRFVLLLLGYFAAIVLAKAVLGTTAALVVFVALSVAVAAWIVRARSAA